MNKIDISKYTLKELIELFNELPELISMKSFQENNIKNYVNSWILFPYSMEGYYMKVLSQKISQDKLFFQGMIFSFHDTSVDIQDSGIWKVKITDEITVVPTAMIVEKITNLQNKLEDIKINL